MFQEPDFIRFQFLRLTTLPGAIVTDTGFSRRHNKAQRNENNFRINLHIH